MFQTIKTTMSDFRVIKRIFLKEKNIPTGKTVHYFGQSELPAPFSLEIIQYFDDDGYYLFYLNEKGEVQTDTYHDSLEGAIEQAKWEFKISENDWEDIG